MKRLALVLLVALFTSVSCSQAMEPLPADVNVIVDMKDYAITLSVARPSKNRAVRHQGHGRRMSRTPRA